MKTYKTGLVIGRFQPFHLGHKYLIEQALLHCDKIIIGIGSSNVVDQNNPYSLEARMEFVKKFIEKENLSDRVIKIVPIEDVPDDDDWFVLAQEKTGPVDVVIGDNDWVSGIYEGKRVPVLKVGHYMRDTLQGVKIRENMHEKKEWEERVPEYLIDLIKKS